MNPQARLLLLAYLAFVSLGLPDTVLGVAWPSLRATFSLPPSAIGAVLGSGVSGYFISGLVAGNVMQRLGVGGLLTTSSALVALGLVGFAVAPTWSLFFPVAFVVGLGSGAIDSALNNYAAKHFSVRHLNWLHACWGLGASLGPVIMTWAIASGAGYSLGYTSIGAALAAMTLAFFVTRRAWGDDGPAPNAAGGAREPRATARQALASGKVWLLILTFLCYTGLETSVGQWCFTWLREVRGLPVEGAGAWTAIYWASLTVGRVALGVVAEWLGPDRLLRAASVGIVAGVVLFATLEGMLGRLGLVVLGASLAPVYPTLMSRTPARVGHDISAHAVGFLVAAATLGSASMPTCIGLLAGRFGLGAIGAVAIALGLAFLVLHELVLRFARERASVVA